MQSNGVTSIVREHFDSLATQYDAKSSARAKYLSAINMLILRKIREENKISGKVLDVGCGTGTRAKAIFSALPMIEIYGSDISSKMLMIAKTKGLAGLVNSDMQFLPFRDESFEVVTCLFNAIGYLSTPIQRIRAFREFYRVLKPSGLLFIDFMNRWHLGEGLSFRRSVFTAFGMYVRSLLPDLENQGNLFFNLSLNGRQIRGFVHGFSCGEIKRLLAKNGFDIVDSLIVGYDSGEIRRHCWQGQYFFIARKTQTPKEVNHEHSISIA